LGGTPAQRRTTPWLRELDLPLPLATSTGQVELDAWNLQRAAQKARLRILDLPLVALHPPAFNASIRRLGNKALTHYEAITLALGRFLPLAPIRICVDRTGGRLRHSLQLARAFPGTGVTRLREDPECQAYRLRPQAGGNLEVAFLEKGDQTHFGIALASCLAKYVREVFMACLNRWFAERLPELRPTRGYYVDGHRFLRDVQKVVQAAGLPREVFVRAR
jgi:hypothetical protein